MFLIAPSYPFSSPSRYFSIDGASAGLFKQFSLILSHFENTFPVNCAFYLLLLIWNFPKYLFPFSHGLFNYDGISVFCPEWVFHFLLLLSLLYAHTAFEGISEAYPQSLLPGVLFGDFLIKGRKWHINKTVRLPLHGFKCMFYNLVLCPLFLNIFVCAGEAISLFSVCIFLFINLFIYFSFWYLRQNLNVTQDGLAFLVLLFPPPKC